MKKLLLGVFLSLLLVCFCQGKVYCAQGWDITKPAGTSNASDLDARIIENNTALDLMLSTYRSGVNLSYASASTITIGAGGIMVSNSAGTTRLMAANTSAITGTWAMIDTGAEANATTYYVYAICSAVTDTTFTVKISTNSATPSVGTYYKRLGSFYNDASGNITNVIGDDGLSDGVVSTLKLKTTTGEVSTSSVSDLTLPGGEYGFYPQIKVNTGGTNATFTGVVGVYNGTTTTTYTSLINLFPFGGATAYAQQRYITASGEDYWIFLLIDKETDAILSAYAAPDHPAYGNGGDFEKTPHPFESYNPETQIIVLVDKDTTEAIKEERLTSNKSILELINNDYKPRMNKKEIYIPLHSGRFIDKQKEMVKTIPDYILVRGITKLTDKEKADRKIIRDSEAAANKVKLIEEKLIQDKIREQAIEALKTEGKIK